MRKTEQGLNKGLPIGVRRTISYIVLAMMCVMCLVWFYILIINSTRSRGELTAGFTPIPSTYLIKNFINLRDTSGLPIVRGMINSIVIATLSATLSVYFSTMTAYAIHAYRFKGRKLIFTFILGIMTIPTQVTALGFVQMISNAGLMDSYLPLVLPSIAAPAVFFYMKQYMDSSLPHSLIEAARIDGASEFRTFNTIALPLMKPAIAVQAIFSFVASWNNYFVPALVLHKDRMKTLPILIAQLRSADFLKFDMGQVYVMILFSIAPVIVVYLILSKHIIGGLTVGGVKG
ncbi:MAG: carbohydrate ABC transporter permease [Lachnospiraceae bacterium]|nr:carbohydrate ABC transporter permease [Lachnospiraceae bacterium]